MNHRVCWWWLLIFQTRFPFFHSSTPASQNPFQVIESKGSIMILFMVVVGLEEAFEAVQLSHGLLELNVGDILELIRRGKCGVGTRLFAVVEPRARFPATLTIARRKFAMAAAALSKIVIVGLVVLAAHDDDDEVAIYIMLCVVMNV